MIVESSIVDGLVFYCFQHNTLLAPHFIHRILVRIRYFAIESVHLYLQYFYTIELFAHFGTLFGESN